MLLAAATFGGGCASGGSTEVMPGCPVTQLMCAGVCTDTSGDGKNCGECGKACVAGEVCSAGACALTCGGGTTKCGTSCLNTQNDLKNCGGCNAHARVIDAFEFV
jgi:hypothetical protein